MRPWRKFKMIPRNSFFLLDSTCIIKLRGKSDFFRALLVYREGGFHSGMLFNGGGALVADPLMFQSTRLETSLLGDGITWQDRRKACIFRQWVSFIEITVINGCTQIDCLSSRYREWLDKEGDVVKWTNWQQQSAKCSRFTSVHRLWGALRMPSSEQRLVTASFASVSLLVTNTNNLGDVQCTSWQIPHKTLSSYWTMFTRVSTQLMYC